ncbi:MAG: hypothetical protein WCP97_01805 [bacterium]
MRRSRPYDGGTALHKLRIETSRLINPRAINDLTSLSNNPSTPPEQLLVAAWYADRASRRSRNPNPEIAAARRACVTRLRDNYPTTEYMTGVISDLTSRNEDRRLAAEGVFQIAFEANPASTVAVLAEMSRPFIDGSSYRRDYYRDRERVVRAASLLLRQVEQYATFKNLLGSVNIKS